MDFVHSLIVLASRKDVRASHRYSGVAGNEFFITPPMVSNPSDKGVHLNSSMILSSLAEFLPAAPTATTSSALTFC